MPDYLYAVIFAVFVALQIVAWILFARKITKDVSNKETVEILEDREAKLFRLYSNIEELMDAFEEYVDEVRTEIDSEHKDLIEISRQAADVFAKAMQIKTTYAQREEAEIGGGRSIQPAEQAWAAAKAVSLGTEVRKEHISNPGRQDKSAEAGAGAEPQHFSTLSQKDRDAVRKFATKAQKVRYLVSCGLTESEIARELDIGRGEVHLIAELEK